MTFCSNKVNNFFAVILVVGMTLVFLTAFESRAVGTENASVQESLTEYWYVVKISGSAVGFANDARRKLPSGTIYRTHMDLTMSRMGTKLNMFMSFEEFDDKNGRPRSFKMTIKTSSLGMEISGVLENDTLRVQTVTPGYSDVKLIPWEPGAMGQAAGEIFMEEQLKAGKTEFSLRIFDPQITEFKTVKIKKIETKQEEIDGKMQQPIAVEHYENENENPSLTAWFDESYQPWRTVIRQMGLEIILERVAPEQIESIELEPNFDVIKQSMIRCDGYPGDPGAVKDVTLRLKFERPPPARRDLSGPNQKVLQRGADWIELLVSRETVTRKNLSREQQAPFLESDRYFQIKNPSIRAIADSVSGEMGGSNWELARALAGWVNRHISNKNFEMGFASAPEVLKARAGDCTEHSVLLTALLRAAGIPARPALGLAYANGTFVGHMWTEVYVDHWRSLDALDPKTDPIRIRVTASKDGRALNESDLVQAYDIVGGMTVEVTGFNLDDAR
jgi:hypothetical protein